MKSHEPHLIESIQRINKNIVDGEILIKRAEAMIADPTVEEAALEETLRELWKCMGFEDQEEASQGLDRLTREASQAGQAIPTVLEAARNLAESVHLLAEAIGQGAVKAAQAAQLVRIPSDKAVIPLFTLGAPNQRDTFSVMKNEEDGELKSVTISLRQLQNDGDQLSLGYNDPEFFLVPEIRRNLETGRWREEALSVLPRMLGPEALSVYFWTWADADGAGNIFFEPGKVAGALGLTNTTRNRKRMETIAETLTRVELRLVRKFGPSMGDESGEYTGRLIQPSTEQLKITPSRDGGRGPRKILIYRHALPMVNIRRKFNVGIPAAAFQLVGQWEKGAGQKKAGYQALTLLAHCYILARTFATRERGTKGDITHLGPEGFEMPLEAVITAAGFATPADFTHDPKWNTTRIREAVKRLVKDFGFFGKGSEVFTGPDGKPRFRFVAPEDLQKQLEAFSGAQLVKIEAAQAQARRKSRRKV